MAQVPYWWNRDRSSCRHLWYPITGLRRNAPRIVHLLASVLENGASHFTSKYPLLRMSLSLSRSLLEEEVAIPLRFERGERLFDTRRTTLDFR